MGRRGGRAGCKRDLCRSGCGLWGACFFASLLGVVYLPHPQRGITPWSLMDKYERQRSRLRGGWTRPWQLFDELHVKFCPVDSYYQHSFEYSPNYHKLSL